jgi:2',3'-cyclic-nucleotide 2'-phosphodiesterase (5'-nucleotidase family)
MKRLKIALCFVFFFTLAICSAYGGQSEIRILHVNDFHGFAEPYKPLGSDEMLGGIAYLAGKADELRKEKPSLLFSAGDMIQGNNWANLSQGESVIELMNEMEFDAMVLGNHEFDFGQDVLRKRISEAKFPVLGANVEGLGNLKPYIIKNLKGVKVGIIGVVTEDVPISTHPRNVAGLKFMSPIDTVEKYIAELKNKADLIIILSHIGYPVDRILAERVNPVRKEGTLIPPSIRNEHFFLHPRYKWGGSNGVKGIDVIVGGHSHTKIEKPVKVGNTIIVQAWEHAKVLGVLDLTVEDGKIIGFEGRLEEIKPKIGKEGKAAFAIVEKYKQKVNAVLNERVGEAEVDLDGENVRRRETNLGNLIADIMRHASGADVTIINGGGIRTSIKKGEIRVKDIYSVSPFDNYIVAIKLTGKQIREALEHGVSAVEEEEGRFPQVSGLSFKYSPSNKRGSRVQEVLIAGKPIDPDQEYIVATNDFLAAGGDGYKAFGEAIKTSKDFSIIGGMMKGGKVVYSDSGWWLRDVVVEYLKEMRRIAPKVESRIIEVH